MLSKVAAVITIVGGVFGLIVGVFAIMENVNNITKGDKRAEIAGAAAGREIAKHAENVA